MRPCRKVYSEDLAESAWDYQDISLPEASLGRPVQVVALVASFARVVVPALREAGFRISVTLRNHVRLQDCLRAPGRAAAALSIRVDFSL